MTSLPNRPHTALVIVDVQNDVMAEAWQPGPVIANIQELVDKAREAGTQVIWVQHQDENLPKGTAGWEYVPELRRADDEALIAKSFGDSFEATSLEDVLAAAKVGHMVVAGAETDACIRSTIHGAFTRGYDVTLVGDAHTCSDSTSWGAPAPEHVIAHTNLYWKYQDAPGRTAAVVAARDVHFV